MGNKNEIGVSPTSPDVRSDFLEIKSLKAQRISQGWDACDREMAAERMRKRWEDKKYRDKMTKQAHEDTGHFHTEEYKRIQSEKRGSVSIKAFPLLLRGAMVEDIVQITGLTRNQVENLIEMKRRKGELKRSTKEEQSKAKSIGSKGKPKNEPREYTSYQQNAFLFARRAIEKELIGKDLSRWEKLQEIYRERERELPENFADRLRLEIYLSAILDMNSNNNNMMNRYRKLGMLISQEWSASSLREEERFIESSYSKKSDSSISLDQLPAKTNIIKKYAESLSKLDLPVHVRNAILVYLLTYEYGDLQRVAKKLGISVEEAQSSYNLALHGLSEKHWDLMEDLARRDFSLT